MIVMMRVDHRLIHGQVALSWTAHLGADCILVPDDNVASDEIQKATLRMAAPAGVKVVIKTVQDSIDAINSGKTDKYHLFIVTKTVSAASQLVSACEQVREVNLGGVADKEGSRKLTKSVFLTDDERTDVNLMIDAGATVYTQQVPTDSKELLTQHI